MPRWEYLLKRFDEFNPKTHVILLNELGHEGWELIAVVNGQFFYFKRSKE